MHDLGGCGPPPRLLTSTLSRRRALVALLACALSMSAGHALAQSDPLPSWNAGAVKKSITDFVARVTMQGGADFVPPAERIATFDNDGTLWCEQPMYFEAAFGLDRVKAMAPQHPEWKQQQPFRAFLAGDRTALSAQGEKALLTLVMAAHSGMTTDAFAKSVADWLAEARHPRFNRPYNELIYQPMVELLGYLRANGFKTFIVSGGGVEFMRVWTEKAYGIPPEQVVGSSGVTRFEITADGRPVLMKLDKIEFVDDGPGKPVGINRFIGRRPIFAFGNSDGDLQMLQWTTLGGSGARFAGIVHHTDDVREYAYDRGSRVGKLDKAWDEAKQRGWTIVDMKQDWKEIFPRQVRWVAPWRRSRERPRPLRLDRSRHPAGDARRGVLPARLAAWAHREIARPPLGRCGRGCRLDHADLWLRAVADRDDLGLCRRARTA